jgi:hypothetical protein
LLKRLLFTAALLAAPMLQAQNTLSVEQLVDRHVNAIGGRENIEKVHSVTKHLVYREPSFTIPNAFIALMRPYYKTIGDPNDKHVDVNEGYDGSSWEYYADPGVVLRTVGAAAAASRHGTQIFDPLVDFKSNGTKVELSGNEVFDGKPAYKLHVTLADGFESYLFLDSQTFLILGDRRAVPIHAFGDSIKSERHVGDYRAVEGVLFPFRSAEIEIATGKELNSDTIQSIEVNPQLDPDFFSPPEFKRTALQQFLEQLYMERSDANAVLWSYRGFRSANPAIDTRPGVEFIGYQMAKMSDYNGAVELLKANAADYPNSASAQFGLGRAYQGKGDSENARAAFQRALQIDPNFKKASVGLDALK